MLVSAPALARRPAKDPDLPRLREVLRGALYRSGTPSEQGLQQLCKRGFRRVYSLYGPRTTAHGPPNQPMAQRGADQRSCELTDGTKRSLPWVSAHSNRQRSMPQILRDVLESVREPDKGPVLVHCWNGLHYAGMISAMVLRQLCGATADAAEAYWWSTTSQGEHYPHVVQHIRSYRPVAGYALTPKERERLCPDLPRQGRPVAGRSKAQAQLTAPTPR